MKPIIEVKHIGKKYSIGSKQNQQLSLRDSIYQMARSFSKSKKETFWALQDVSFTVAQGECLGIIGKNGAGKSTLLKILSQITPPSEGEIIMRGRVASLLEVGTGFHSELTGRENIFLNGSILGMKRDEILRQFDEIVDFSGVEHFLDTPLKHYSSGMQLRLAFSVAAHLNPEILLIDEVLAVGDAEFQKKCLGKMDEVSKSGRTVIFVSHDLGMIQQLCHKGLWLNEGKVRQTGLIKDVIFAYENWVDSYSQSTYTLEKAEGNKKSVIENITFSKDSYAIDEPISISISVQTSAFIKKLIFGLSIHNYKGQIIGSQIININTSQDKGIQEYKLVINNAYLAPGRYFFSLAIAETTPYHILHSLEHIVTFEIIPQINNKVFLWDKNFGDRIFNDTSLYKI